MSTCVLQANVLIRGVIVLDVNWIIWFISVYVTCQEHSIVFQT